MRNLLITRTVYEAKQTLGEGYVLGEAVAPLFQFKTLELPWLNNQQKISCIPTGTYKVVKRTSPKYGNHFHILDVPGRSFILIHHGNYYSDVLGCILPGEHFRDLNKDGYLDVTNSRNTMNRLLYWLPDEFELTIR